MKALLALLLGLLFFGCGRGSSQQSEIFGFVRGDSAVTTQRFEDAGLGRADTVIIFQANGTDLVVVEFCDGERVALHEKWLNPLDYECQDCPDTVLVGERDCLVVFYTYRDRVRVWTEEGVIRMIPDWSDGRTVITADLCKDQWSEVGIWTWRKSGTFGYSRICSDDSLKMVTRSEMERIRRDCEVE